MEKSFSQKDIFSILENSNQVVMQSMSRKKLLDNLEH